jgi:hypothetical protein
MVMKGKTHTVKLPTRVFNKMKRLRKKHEPNYAVINRGLIALARGRK